MAVPDLLMIPYENVGGGRFTDIGRYGDGKQFMAFVTAAFPADWWDGSRSPAFLRNRWAEYKRYYAVLHRFDPQGSHLGTDTWSGGTYADNPVKATERAEEKLDQLIASLGPYQKGDIWVKPFGVEDGGYFFGLVYHHAEDPDFPEDSDEYVMLEPNDIMFHPPWDSGSFST